MDISILMAICAGATIFLLGILVYILAPKSQGTRSFFFFCICVAAWNLGDIGKTLVSYSKPLAIMIEKLSFSFASFIPLFYFWYIHCFLKIFMSKWKIFVLTGLSGVFFGFSIFGLVVLDLEASNGSINLIPGYFLTWFYVYFFVTDIYLIGLMTKKFRANFAAKVNLITQIFIALGLLFNYRCLFRAFQFKNEHIFEVLFVIVIAYTILKYRFLEIFLVLRKGSAYTITGVVIGVTTVLVGWILRVYPNWDLFLK